MVRFINPFSKQFNSGTVLFLFFLTSTLKHTKSRLLVRRGHYDTGMQVEQNLKYNMVLVTLKQNLGLSIL